MTKDQEMIANIFSIVTIVTLAIVVLHFLWCSKEIYIGFFRGIYKVRYFCLDFYVAYYF